MFRVVLLASIIALAGCIGEAETKPDPKSAAPDDAVKPTEVTAETPATAEDPGPAFVVETFEHDSTLDAAVRVPPTIGAPIEVEVDSEALELEVPGDVAVLILELSWADRIDGYDRGDLSLRAIDGDDRYFYSGGMKGTPDDPVYMWLENPASSYDISPVAADATVDQDYKIVVTFVRGDAPESYEAFLEQALPLK